MSVKINSKEYKIIKLLGKGGFGEVYLISDKNGDKYAVKKLFIKSLTEEEIKEIENEGKILSNISNEHIVKYYDSFKDREFFFILMEY